MKKQLATLGLIACLSIVGSMVAFAGTSRVKIFGQQATEDPYASLSRYTPGIPAIGYTVIVVGSDTISQDDIDVNGGSIVESAFNTDGGKIPAVCQPVPEGYMPEFFPNNNDFLKVRYQSQDGNDIDEVFNIYRLPSSMSADSMGFQEYAIYANGAGTQNPSTEKTASWANDSKGWWIQYSDGTYLTNGWYQSPESGLWYYMGSDGYMLTDTTTPDGYYVNADGVYITATQEKSSLEIWKEEFRTNWETAYKKASDEAAIATPNTLSPIKYTFSMDYTDEITGDMVRELCENCAVTITGSRYTHYWYNYSGKNGVATITAVNSVGPIPDSMKTVE